LCFHRWRENAAARERAGKVGNDLVTRERARCDFSPQRCNVRLDARQSCYARALQFDGMLVTYVTPERRAARIAHLFEDFRETGNVVWLVGRKERD
tara:strand:+ start:1187 stop:1474 length:288 start_codon:yes stop_codon:yes gene_type:complete